MNLEIPNVEMMAKLGEWLSLLSDHIEERSLEKGKKKITFKGRKSLRLKHRWEQWELNIIESERKNIWRMHCLIGRLRDETYLKPDFKGVV